MLVRRVARYSEYLAAGRYLPQTFVSVRVLILGGWHVLDLACVVAP